MNRFPVPRPPVLLAAALLVAGCRSTPAPSVTTVDAETARLSKTAHQLYAQGAPDQALPFYERALARARAGDDAAAIGRLACNAAICALETGRPAEARRWLREAAFALRTLNQPAPDVHLLDLRARLDLGEVEGVRDDAAHLADDPGAPDAARAHARLIQAEALARLGNWEEALGVTAQARRLGGDHAPAAFKARIAMNEGRIALGQQRPGPAAGRFEEAAALARTAGLGPLVPEALHQAALAAAAVDARAAAALFYRAARAAAAGGQPPARVQTLVDQGLKAAREAGDEELVRLLTDVKIPDAKP